MNTNSAAEFGNKVQIKLLLLCTYTAQGCMLGCRDYVELAMYRPRVGTSLQSSKQPNTIKTSGAGHHPRTPADEYSNVRRRTSALDAGRRVLQRQPEDVTLGRRSTSTPTSAGGHHPWTPADEYSNVRRRTSPLDAGRRVLQRSASTINEPSERRRARSSLCDTISSVLQHPRLAAWRSG